MSRFSFSRWGAIVRKEFIQLQRDRITFAMIVVVPIMQIAVFGFAINADPRHLPTAVVRAEQSEFTRSLVAALEHSTYFDVVEELPDEEAAREALARGRVQFVLNIPADFTVRLLRGERPAILLEADATDPAATGMALGAVQPLVSAVLAKDLRGPHAALENEPPAFEIRVHRLYNPENITRYNIVPGLMGVILTMTMVMMTAMAITRERERGTMENLLATPVLPLEVMTGKIVPYVAIGLVQATIILVTSHWIFGVPFLGSPVALYFATLLFIACNLTVGITLSSLATSQLQAMQMATFYFLPNILLSGFMFPYAGMPRWARWLAQLLPLTHFNRIVRGIVLKGNTFADMVPHLWPLALFMLVVMGISTRFYRRTLD